MKVKIYKKDTNGSPVIVNTLDIGNRKSRSIFDVIRSVTALQNSEDVLGLGYTAMIEETGISSMYQRNGIWYSYEPEKCEADPETYYFWQKPVKINGGVSDEYYLFQMYDQGYVLEVKCDRGGLFGYGGTFYFKSMGRRNARCGGLDDCRTWKNKKNMLKWITENESKLRYLSQNGWVFNVCAHNILFEQEEKERIEKLNKSKKDSWYKDSEDLDNLIRCINAAADEGADTEKSVPMIPELSPDELTEDIIKDEIMYRMKRLGLHQSVISDFMKYGKILKSEFGGFLYDLSDAEKAVAAQVKEQGFTPYHVITSHTTLGDMIDVLYVSKDVEEWRCERRDNKNWMYIYNSADEGIGPVQVRASIGGLIRSDIIAA